MARRKKFSILDNYSLQYMQEDNLSRIQKAMAFGGITKMEINTIPGALNISLEGSFDELTESEIADIIEYIKSIAVFTR